MNLEFNEIGNLHPNKYEVTFAEAKAFSVDAFPESSTRLRNWNGFCNFLQLLIDSGLTNMQVWVDGSFVTNKQDPNDVDCVIYLKPDVANACSEKNRNILMGIFSEKGNVVAHKEFFTDPYMLLDVTNNPDFPYYSSLCEQKYYWENFWGHDRNNNQKGFIVLTIEGGVCQ